MCEIKGKVVQVTFLIKSRFWPLSSAKIDMTFRTGELCLPLIDV